MPQRTMRLPRRRGLRKIPPEDLPGIDPRLFRELEERIQQPLLQPDPLPEEFLISEGKEGEGKVVFQGKRYDLNITVFKPPGDREQRQGSGVFIISNGSGVAINMVDHLVTVVEVCGVIDLKRDFVAEKITAAFRMALAARPDVEAIALNIISGTAVAEDIAKAVRHFSIETVGRLPVLLRFNGPGMGARRERLYALEAHHENIILANSTVELVDRTIEVLAGQPIRRLSNRDVGRLVEDALVRRAVTGVTVDPEGWLTADRTLQGLFGTKEETRVGILGFGYTGAFHTRGIHAAGVRVVWIATPTAGKHPDSGIPGVNVYLSVSAAVAACGSADIILSYAPAAQSLDAAKDCLAACPDIRLMVVMAENMLYDQSIRLMDMLEAADVALIGPNSPGILIVANVNEQPDHFKIGSMPAHLFSRAGGLSVIGRSGTMVFDISDQAADNGVGTRVAWTIGGDKYTGLGFLEALLMLEQDPDTLYIVLNGEAGGIQEQLAARLVATGIISKPVVALVTGKTLPAGTMYGHQSSVKYTSADDPYVKERYLREAGVICVDSADDVVATIEVIARQGWDIHERRQSATWEQIVADGKKSGRHWHDTMRRAYNFLYTLVGSYQINLVRTRNTAQFHRLTALITDIGIGRFRGLLKSTVDTDAFVAGFCKSCEYVADLVQNIKEIGLEEFQQLIDAVFSKASFNMALANTPWAAADIVNEADQIGIVETSTVINKTLGMKLFRETLAARPWSTGHAFRSINNMRWWNFVKAYRRQCTFITGDNESIKASWRINPWVSVKLVRGYDRVPDGGLEQALEIPACWALFIDKSRSDPQGLLDIGKRAFRISEVDGVPFHEAYHDQVRAGVPAKALIDDEIAAMDESSFRMLVDEVFTPPAIAKARAEHPTSTAQALRIINHTGPDEIVRIFEINKDKLDTPAFYKAVGRNFWMAVDMLRALRRMDPTDVQWLVDYVLTQKTFDVSVAEHQWGTSQALHKIADMGTRSFFEAHRVLEDVTRDRTSFRTSFCKNPRDALEIIQVIDRLGEDQFARFMADPETREAFLHRMRVNPRNSAHFLQEVLLIGVGPFNCFIDRDFGRPILNAMLRSKGCKLVRAMRRVSVVGVEDFQRHLRHWLKEEPAPTIDAENALDVCGLIKDRILEGRVSDPTRKIVVKLDGQPNITVSAGQLYGLFQSYPEWGDVLFKALTGENPSRVESLDLYHLVSGRKRFQALIISVLRNFIPQREIRRRINRGEALISELRALKGVTQPPPHRFDVYDHTMEVVDSLQHAVLPLEFAPAETRAFVGQELDKEIDGVTRRDLLILGAALHDLGKAKGAGEHVANGVAAAEPILERLGLSPGQKHLVLALIRFHKPKRLRRQNESWSAFMRRGGLRRLFEQMLAGGRNPYPLETILHYHSDILGRQGSQTLKAEVTRREEVTNFLLAQYIRQGATIAT